MKILDESVVRAEEIDSLGHLNARFYMERVARANEALIASLGLDLATRDKAGAVLARPDAYIRYQREQRLGAQLQVRSGLIDVDGDSLRIFHEVRNAVTDDIASVTLATFTLQSRATRTPMPLPAAVVETARAVREPLPDYGNPRSLTLTQPRLDVTFQHVFDRVGAFGDGATGMLTERVLPQDICDEFGFVRDGEELLPAIFRRGRPEELEVLGPPITVSPSGLRYGWALMELRTLQVSRPRAGDRVRSIGAILGMNRKVRQSRRWTFNGDSGALISIDDTVALLLDIDGRQAIEIPADLREELSRQGAPELA